MELSARPQQYQDASSHTGYYNNPWENEDAISDSYDAGILNQDPLAILIAFEEAEALEH